jgi:NAD+ synthase
MNFSWKDLAPLQLNPRLVVDFLTAFLREEIHDAGFQKVVLGLSGGVDSALAAYLAVRALGAQNVVGIKMPYAQSSPASLQDADQVAKELGIRVHLEPVTPMAESFLQIHRDAGTLRRGNLLARLRMIILYDYSQMLPALVLGTSNKSELMLGYGTIFGDLASAVNPLGDLYKTQVYQLAKFLELPPSILRKPPSADLVAGQTDESDLGYSYEELDAALLQLVERRRRPETLVAAGFPRALVEKVDRLVHRFQFKRQGPVIPKIQARTVGVDFHLCRDNGH